MNWRRFSLPRPPEGGTQNRALRSESRLQAPCLGDKELIQPHWLSAPPYPSRGLTFSRRKLECVHLGLIRDTSSQQQRRANRAGLNSAASFIQS